MTTKSTKVTFDALANKWMVQEEIAKEIAGLSPEGEIEYFRRASGQGALGDWWRTVKMPADDGR